MTGRSPGIRIEGAAENNLRDVSVTLPPGLTAVVGVSGSGKSSLAFDTLYAEARRRHLETLSLGLAVAPDAAGSSPLDRRAWRRRSRSPRTSSTATRTRRSRRLPGIHPFLRVLFARFAERRCPECGTRPPSRRARARSRACAARRRARPRRGPRAARRAGRRRPRAAPRLARGDRGRAAIEVDGSRWSGGAARPGAAARHRRPGRDDARAGAPTSASIRRRRRRGGRARLQRARRGRRRPTRLVDPRAALPGLRAAVPAARPDRLPRRGRGRTRRVPARRLHARRAARARRRGGRARRRRAGDSPAARAPVDQVARRLEALDAVGLGYIRARPVVADAVARRGAAAAARGAAGEPDRGPAARPRRADDRARPGPGEAAILDQVARLRGPVVMVEHDRCGRRRGGRCRRARARAPGDDGGRVVFQGTAGGAVARPTTPSGRWFSRETGPRTPRRRAAGRRPGSIGVEARACDNLRGFDCEFPVGRLTVVTGPSGAGKTTLVRDVLVASLDGRRAGRLRGASRVRELRPVAVDQAPIGRNRARTRRRTRASPTRIRDLFARGERRAAVDASPSTAPRAPARRARGWARSSSSCRTCRRSGSTCEACGGRRFRRRDARGARSRSTDGVASIDRRRLRSVRRRGAALLARRTAARRGSSRRSGASGSATSRSASRRRRCRAARPSGSSSRGSSRRRGPATSSSSTSRRPASTRPTSSAPDRRSARLVDGGSTVIVVEHQPGRRRRRRLGRPARARAAGPRRRAARARGPPRRRPASASRRPGRGRSRAAGRAASPRSGSTARRAQPPRRLGRIAEGRDHGRRRRLGLGQVVARPSTCSRRRRRGGCSSACRMYERQSVREGPEAPVGSIEGLGPTVSIRADGASASRAAHGRDGDARSASTSPSCSRSPARDACPRCGARQRRAGCTGRAAVDVCPHAAPRPARRASPLPAVDVRSGVPRRVDGVGHGRRGAGRAADRPAGRCRSAAGAMYSPGYFPGVVPLEAAATGGYEMLRRSPPGTASTRSDAVCGDEREAAREAFLVRATTSRSRSPAAERQGARRRSHVARRLRDHRGLGHRRPLHRPRLLRACAGERLRPEYRRRPSFAGMNRRDLHRLPVVGRRAPARRGSAAAADSPHWVAPVARRSPGAGCASSGGSGSATSTSTDLSRRCRPARRSGSSSRRCSAAS